MLSNESSTCSRRQRPLSDTSRGVGDGAVVDSAQYFANNGPSGRSGMLARTARAVEEDVEMPPTFSRLADLPAPLWSSFGAALLGGPLLVEVKAEEDVGIPCKMSGDDGPILPRAKAKSHRKGQGGVKEEHEKELQTKLECAVEGRSFRSFRHWKSHAVPSGPSGIGCPPCLRKVEAVAECNPSVRAHYAAPVD